MLKHRQYTYFYIFSHATLNETLTAKYDGVLLRTPYTRPKSGIYTRKRDNKYPYPFHMRSPPPPRAGSQWRGLLQVLWLDFRGGLVKNLTSSLIVWQGALTFCLPRVTSCSPSLMILLEDDLPGCLPMRKKIYLSWTSTRWNFFLSPVENSFFSAL